MRKVSALAILSPLFLSGCGLTGDKSGNLSLIYGITAAVAALLLVGYCCLRTKKEKWFLLLFSSVLVVNLGYWALSLSSNLTQALWANRVAYLGSVFLPLSMFMIILGVTNTIYPKWLPAALLSLGCVVFVLAASPGYCDLYYKQVSFARIDGMGTLVKVYGPLHISYLLYLVGYFAAMVAAIVHSIVKGKIRSTAYAVILSLAVFVNIGVWLIEQFVHIDFEILAVSYIITESFLLGLHLVLMETEKSKKAAPKTAPAVTVSPSDLLSFRLALEDLTPKEHALYNCYLSGMTTAQVMEHLKIKENTLKFHNKNLYSKLGVSSRKQLLEIARKLPQT